MNKSKENKKAKGVTLKDAKGITLISLVVTIIVLVILAAVSINLILGENGLIKRAQTGTHEYDKAGTIETIRSDIYDKQLEKLTSGQSGKLTEAELNAILGEYGNINGENLAPWEKNYEIPIIEIYNEESATGELTIADLVNNGTIKIGDYVAYEPTQGTFNWSNTPAGDTTTYATYSGTTSNATITTQTGNNKLNWRVLDIVDGQVRLISDAPTTSEVCLCSFDGYNNAVYLIDEVCKTLYSGDKGRATSLKIEDIEKYLTYDYTQYANPDVDTGKYGGTKEYTSDDSRYYPSIFAGETTGWVDDTRGTTYGRSQQNSLINQTSANKATSKIKVTQTHWDKSMVASDFINFSTNDNIYYKLFINNGSNYSPYWLASRCVDAYSDSAEYKMHIVWNGRMDSSSLYGTFGSNYYDEHGVRPVVSLNSGITVDTSDTTKDGTTSGLAWELK